MLPIKFEYITECGEKAFLSILTQVTRHYPGERMFRIRTEGESGWIAEEIVVESYIRNCLKRRVEVEG